MKKLRSINELLSVGNKQLTVLTTKSQERTVVLNHVCKALPPQLAANVVSAGIEGGQLTIGAAGAQWAARLRYVTDTLKVQVGGSLGIELQSIRIKVVRPRA